MFKPPRRHDSAAADRAIFFTDLVDLSVARPDPSLTTGDTSPVGIDAFVQTLASDFRPTEAASELRDRGSLDGAASTDIEGTVRPQGSAADVGPYEWTETD